MKKVLLSTIFIAFAVQINAQVTLQVPTWGKFVKISREGVNLRKSPSTNSPRLVRQGGGGEYEFKWTTNPKAEVYHATNELLPVIEENDKWYKLYIHQLDYTETELAGSEGVWVMKNFCQVVKPEKLSDQDDSFELEKNIGYNCKRIEGSKNLFTSWYYLHGYIHMFCITRVVDNFVIMADYGVDGVQFANRFTTYDENGMPEFHPEKVSVKEISQFERQHTPKFYRVSVKIDGQMNEFMIDAAKYPGKLRKVVL